jgi:hypothetical protein
MSSTSRSRSENSRSVRPNPATSASPSPVRMPIAVPYSTPDRWSRSPSTARCGTDGGAPRPRTGAAPDAGGRHARPAAGDPPHRPRLPQTRRAPQSHSLSLPDDHQEGLARRAFQCRTSPFACKRARGRSRPRRSQGTRGRSSVGRLPHGWYSRKATLHVPRHDLHRPAGHLARAELDDLGAPVPDGRVPRADVVGIDRLEQLHVAVRADGGVCLIRPEPFSGARGSGSRSGSPRPTRCAGSRARGHRRRPSASARGAAGSTS